MISKLYSFEIQLNKLASRLVSSNHLLNIFEDKIINLIALQMDNLLEDTDTINQQIDAMEAYIRDARLTLEFMANELLYMRDQLPLEYDNRPKTINDQEHILEQCTTEIDQFSSFLNSLHHCVPNLLKTGKEVVI
ncbi:uncharacterized protein BX663DRAFT_526340 [Cokeromyces recurvatus]|uniref:uncharacterized protein n=1 Tax=Cokeromyces recurvatus TaxID=90255 RepID=UPI00222078B1|nr:uncharacterized protein BX663DRAFT_526340 [Cokeromyces recurvatus]KAI7898019.1 hypothetical protein BX663DRAFT_526340 [Cokeromyces recurvatus]